MYGDLIIADLHIFFITFLITLLLSSIIRQNFVILDRLQNDSEENIQTIPTIGFNVEVLQYKNIKFQVWYGNQINQHYLWEKSLSFIWYLLFKKQCLQVWDLGGQTSIRPYWRCYYPNTDAIIFVVDSCDSDRLGIAKQELMAMLEVRNY